MMEPAFVFLVVGLGIYLAAGLGLAIVGSAGGAATRGSPWPTYGTELATVTLVLLPAYLGPVPFVGVVLCVSALSSIELFRVLAAAGHAPVVPLGVGCGSLLVFAAGVGGEELVYATFIGSLACLFIPAVARRDLSTASDAMASTLLGVVYPGLCAAHLVLLHRLDNGFNHVLYLFAIIELNDSAAWFAGRSFGTKKIWPSLSPKKTYVGTLAGLAISVIAAVGFRFLVPGFSWYACVAAGAAIGVAGQLGDLVASVVKRSAGVKDYGTLVAGQGGVLDVYDSFIFTAPLFYLVVSRLA